MADFRTKTYALAVFSLLSFCMIPSTCGHKLSSLGMAEEQTVGAKNQTIVIALCGSNDGPTDTVEIYSLTSNSRVKSGASAPELRDGSATAIFNNTIYVVGGSNGGYYESTFWSYDIAKNQWKTSLPNAPAAIFGSAGVEVGGRMYILGGVTSGLISLEKVYAYETRLRKWYTLDTEIPQFSETPCAVAQEKHLYYMPEGSLYHSDDGANTWHRLSSPSETRSDAACVAVGKDSILLAGGLNANNEVLNSVEIYNITTDQWRTVAPMITTRHGGSGELLLPSKNNVLICGGEKTSSTKSGLKTCETYDWNKNKWSQASYEMDQPRTFFGLFVTQAQV